MSQELEIQLLAALKEAYENCKTFGYYPNYFLRMIADEGPTGAVKSLINKEHVSTGFERLWLARRLDLSVEAIACQERFRSLFTPAELKIAEERTPRARI